MSNMKPKSRVSHYKGQTLFFPIVEFFTKCTGKMEYVIYNPQPTRSKAITVANNYIKNHKQDNGKHTNN